MPIESPQLADLRYDEVFDQLVRRIPVHTPEWTDFNDSDPGITLLQLFSQLAEQVGYRLNRVPEKNYIELLKLLGVRLQPARAATTRLALLLQDPRRAVGEMLPVGTRAKAKQGNPPPMFETEVATDIVPAEPAVLLTTRSPWIHDLNRKAGGKLLLTPASPPRDKHDNDWLRIIWDGKTPAYKTLPVNPVPLFKDPPDAKVAQEFLWIGLRFNPDYDAGFRGVQVSLTVQFDDDEQPSLSAVGNCQCPVETLEGTAPPVDWLWYSDGTATASSAILRPLPGRIDDSTQQLTRSGTIRFTVPRTLGGIPKDRFVDLRESTAQTALDACTQLGARLASELAADPVPTVGVAFKAVVNNLQQTTAASKTPIPHPLDAKFQDPNEIQGWLRIRLAPHRDRKHPPLLRMISFNAVPVGQALTETNELLGISDGRPGQEYRLLHGNVIAGSLELAILESPSAQNLPLTPWTEIDSLDVASPFDRVFELDREAGVIRFGDGRRGRIPPLVPNGGNVVALRYRHGGGLAGEIPVAAIERLDSGPASLSGAVNFVKATGGRDAEQLADAKLRARKELSTRSRAVTADDFVWISLQTPGVRVGRAVVAPLRRPLLPTTKTQPISRPACGHPLTGQPSGLAAFTAAGAVSVVVVPDEPGAEPSPTPSFLRTVCRHLDQHRLVTTEVFVVPPQYVRLCEFFIVVKPHPGYTRVQLQDLVESRLAGWLHVLHGGDDQTGFPFGGQLHVADLISLVVRTDGVERVETLTCRFTRTKSDGSPRQGQLVLCPKLPGDVDRIELALEETVSFDPSKMILNLTSLTSGSASSSDPLCSPYRASRTPRH
jgi:hypothetical protein